jgi:hypothetical protein
MFRGNSLATKAMEAYQKLVAERYLKVVRKYREKIECKLRKVNRPRMPIAPDFWQKKVLFCTFSIARKRMQMTVNRRFSEEIHETLDVRHLIEVVIRKFCPASGNNR